MHPLRKVLLATFLLLPAFLLVPARLSAQFDDRELYHAEVCNEGQITVDVAVAYRDFGINDEFWMIERWWHVPPGECKGVWRHFYAPNNVLNFRPFPLHLAFAFTDSTGVWGAAMVKPPGDTAQSHLKLCVASGNQNYKENDDDPATACKRTSEGFLIPASIDWEPTHGSTCCNSFNHEYGPPARFTVALGPSDRAIPLGPRASPGEAVSGPGVLTDLVAIVSHALRDPGAPRARIYAKDYAVTNFTLQVCMPMPLVKKDSWADPQSPRAQAVRTAIQEFMATHRFRDGASVAEETQGYGSPGEVLRDIRVTETAGRFGVEEVRECSHESYVDVTVAAVEQPGVVQPPPAKPAPKPAEDSDARFGDLLGPGGFVKPPSTSGPAPTPGTGDMRRKVPIPEPFGEGTLTAMFNGRKITRWRGQVADQKWYYEDGSLVTRDRNMRGLAGVENSPLFDDRLYNPRVDKSKQTEIMKVLQHELEGERGYQTAVKTDDFGRLTYILQRKGIEALGLEAAYEDRVQVAVHPYALDIEHAKVEKGRNSGFTLAIPCRKGLTARSSSSPTEGFEDACAVERPIMYDRLGDHLPAPQIVFVVPSEASGGNVIWALWDLQLEMDNRFRRGSVESR